VASRGEKIEDVKRGKKFQRMNVVAARYESADGKINRVAPLCYAKNMNNELFENWFKTKLVNSVSKGSTIIMDKHRFTARKN